VKADGLADEFEHPLPVAQFPRQQEADLGEEYFRIRTSGNINSGGQFLVDGFDILLQHGVSPS
jgi:hypothetical protein